jgi:hypothetical protein
LKADHQDIPNKQEIAVCRNIKLHDGNAKKVLTVITLQIKFRPSQGGLSGGFDRIIRDAEQ